MKYVDEFRDPVLAQHLLEQIKTLLPQIEITKDRPLQFMEFCGGHTHTIFRYGIEQLLPKTIELIHGPGCPVCVLPMGRGGRLCFSGRATGSDLYHFWRRNACAGIKEKFTPG